MKSAKSSSAAAAAAGTRARAPGAGMRQHHAAAARRRGIGKAMNMKGRDASGEGRAIVIGSGMAGLASALALARFCREKFSEVLVLERRSESEAKRGAALTLWSNGWRALSSLGIADDLKSGNDAGFGNAELLEAVELRKQDGQLMKVFNLSECSNGGRIDVETRGIRRGALSEAMLDAIRTKHGETIRLRYDTQVATVRRGEPGAIVELADGTALPADLIVVCDGARSPTSSSLGLSGPNFNGYSAVRGVASGDAEDDSFRGISKRGIITQIFGKGVRFGLYPLSREEVYWFVCFNSTQGKRLSDPEKIRAEAMQRIGGGAWTQVVVDCVRRTKDEELSYSDIVDNWTPKLGLAGLPSVCWCGDANHTMTPNLGQGGCCALEDAVDLAGAICGASSVAEGVATYQWKRTRRCTPLTVRASLMGAALQIDNPLVCTVRDIVIGKMFKPASFLNHTAWEPPALLPPVS